MTALETAEQGITCNAICPGYVYTPLVEAQIDDQAKAHNIPRERVIKEILLAHSQTRSSPRWMSSALLRSFFRPMLQRRLLASRCRSMAVGPRTDHIPEARENTMNDQRKTYPAVEAFRRNLNGQVAWSSTAAARSAPTRWASIRRFMRQASNRTGSWHVYRRDQREPDSRQRASTSARAAQGVLEPHGA